VAGPYPADTLFVRASRGEFDAVIGVLPRSRTHPGEAAGLRQGRERHAGAADHPHVGGSRHGFDIAGRNAADPGSMIEAVTLAARLARAARDGQAAGAERRP